MLCKRPELIMDLQGNSYKHQVILVDVNIPYKLCCDKAKNNLFFCINADEFSDHSFHLVMFDMNAESSYVIPEIRNGFTSAVDQGTSTVYLGGSSGIYKYSYDKRTVEKPALLCNIDTLDMHYQNQLYYIETSSQHLFSWCKTNKRKQVHYLDNYLLQHFVFDNNGNLYFVNSSGVYRIDKGKSTPSLYINSDLNFRGVAVDNTGLVYFVAQDGIYTIDKENEQLEKMLPLDNGFGVTFDTFNYMIYSDERTVCKLIPC